MRLPMANATSAHVPLMLAVGRIVPGRAVGTIGSPTRQDSGNRLNVLSW